MPRALFAAVEATVSFGLTIPVRRVQVDNVHLADGLTWPQIYEAEVEKGT